MSLSQQLWMPIDSGEWVWTQRNISRNWLAGDMSATGEYQYAYNLGNGIYKSTDFGVTWVFKNSATNARVLSCSKSGQYIIYGAEAGNIGVSRDYGETWTVIALDPRNEEITDICFTANGLKAYICGSEGETSHIYAFDVVTGEKTKIDILEYWSGIDCSLAGNFIIAVSRVVTYTTYRIYTSFNSGATWSNVVRTGAGAQIACSGNADVIVMGENNSGCVYISRDYGITWTLVFTVPGVSWNSADISSDGRVIMVVATDSAVYVSENYGVGWYRAVSSSTAREIAISDQGDKALLINYGSFLMTGDYS